MVAWRIAGKRQLAGIRASDQVAGAVSRGAAGAARRARSPGCRVRHVVSGMRSVRGPRRRRTIEGASTTSHADIRWLPRSPAAEHT